MTICDEAIISPVKDHKSPELGPLALMVATQNDLDGVFRQLKLGRERRERLLMGKLFVANDKRGAFSVTGPMIGAPYAVMVLETLIAWGAKKIIFYGWCGAVSHQVKIGDIIVPNAAMIDEGTSKHYLDDDCMITKPSEDLLSKTKSILKANDLVYREGKVWSTDAIFRETARKATYYQQQGVLGVEMEMSALFAVAQYRGVDLGGILVVSDDISALKWQPGFKSSQFAESRKHVNGIFRQLFRALSDCEPLYGK